MMIDISRTSDGRVKVKFPKGMFPAPARQKTVAYFERDLSEWAFPNPYSRKALQKLFELSRASPTEISPEEYLISGKATPELVKKILEEVFAEAGPKEKYEFRIV